MPKKAPLATNDQIRRINGLMESRRKKLNSLLSLAGGVPFFLLAINLNSKLVNYLYGNNNFLEWLFGDMFPYYSASKDFNQHIKPLILESENSLFNFQHFWGKDEESIKFFEKLFNTLTTFTFTHGISLTGSLHSFENSIEGDYKDILMSVYDGYEAKFNHSQNAPLIPQIKKDFYTKLSLLSSLCYLPLYLAERHFLQSIPKLITFKHLNASDLKSLSQTHADKFIADITLQNAILECGKFSTLGVYITLATYVLFYTDLPDTSLLILLFGIVDTLKEQFESIYAAKNQDDSLEAGYEAAFINLQLLFEPLSGINFSKTKTLTTDLSAFKLTFSDFATRNVVSRILKHHRIPSSVMGADIFLFYSEDLIDKLSAVLPPIKQKLQEVERSRALVVAETSSISYPQQENNESVNTLAAAADESNLSPAASNSINTSAEIITIAAVTHNVSSELTTSELDTLRIRNKLLRERQERLREKRIALAEHRERAMALEAKRIAENNRLRQADRAEMPPVAEAPVNLPIEIEQTEEAGSSLQTPAAFFAPSPRSSRMRAFVEICSLDEPPQDIEDIFAFKF